MIEKVILDYLKTELKTIKVYTEVPQNPPKEYVAFLVTGVKQESPNIYSCMVAIQSYSTSLYNASLLNEKVLDVMDVITALNSVTHCSLNASGSQNNLTTKEYRYQSVFNMTFYRR